MTRKELMSSLLALIAVIALLVGGAVARADAAGKEAVAQAKEEAKSLRATVDINKREADAGNAEVRKDIQAVYNFLLTRKPQERLEAGKK